jgi:serine protease
MRRLIPTFLPVAAAALLAPAAVAAGSPAIAPARDFAPRQVLVKLAGEPRGRTLTLPAGAGVRRTAAALRRNPRVVYAEPNFIATASSLPPRDGFLPDDPGTLQDGSEAANPPGGWASRQWNFLPPEGEPAPNLPASPGGIDAVGAWRNLIEAGRPGAAGVVVAVLDSGVAYRSLGRRFAASPDFSPGEFVPGYDFVGHDRTPLDVTGHGTHVAGTIAEATDNGIGLTGLAYGARVMPLRVLNSMGTGYANQIARSIRYAVRKGADVINMSFNFDCNQRVPMIDEALRFAYRRGVVAVASGGNYDPLHPRATACVSEPATGPRVIGVGASTEGGCIGRYSLAGAAIDVVAPGGGDPRRSCPSILDRPIYQVTLRKGSTDEFAIPDEYEGTSMAAAHVSGVAAMVLASGVLGKQPSGRARVRAVARRLRQTARDLGYPRSLQGAGLIDAARATAVTP